MHVTLYNTNVQENEGIAWLDGLKKVVNRAARRYMHSSAEVAFVNIGMPKANTILNRKEKNMHGDRARLLS